MRRLLFAPSLAAVVAVAACAPAAPQIAAAPIVTPVVRAEHGVAAFDLDAVLDPRTHAPAFAYAGALGAPTIRVRPGDEIRVVLHNHLPGGGEPSNDVNLHFHGLAVSPVAPSDDAMRVAAPGGTVAYDVHVSKHQPPGLYWYHAHAHGQTYWQITNGLSGALVIEGIDARLPALSHMRERILVLRNPMTTPDYGTIPIAARAEPIRQAVLAARRRAGRFTLVDDDDAQGEPCAPVDGMQPTVNGRVAPVIGIDPGEREFFRVVNASAGRYFDVSAGGQPLDLVALDGEPLAAYPGSPPVERVRHIVVAPAGRVEFVLTGTAQPLALRSLCYSSGEGGDRDPEVVLAMLRRDGRAPQGSLAAFHAPAVLGVAPQWRPAATRRVVFTEDDSGFYLNGRRYRMGEAPAFVVRAGTVERWELVNRTDEVHDLHLHQVHFAVERVDGASQEPLHWVDTVTVPPQRYTHSSVTPGTASLLVDFRDPVVRGTFVFHCHILDHEDGGMMASVRVI